MEFLPDFELEEDELEIVDEELEDNLPEDADPNVVAAFQFYKDNNFFSVETEDFDGTPEGLQSLLLKQAEHTQKSFVNNAPEFAKPLYELLEIKGNSFTEDEMIEVLNLIKPKSIDLTDEAQAENYLRESFKKEGMDDEEINDEIDDLKYKDRLLKVAERTYNRDRKLDRTILEDKVEQAKVSQQQEIQEAQEFVTQFQKTINELPWQTETKKAIQEEFQSGAFKQKLETIFKSPKDLADLVAFVKHYGAKGFDLSSYQKAAFSPTIKKVKDINKNYWGSTSVSTNKKQSNTQEFEFDL